MLGLHRSSPAELKKLLEAERAGEAILVCRDGQSTQRLFVLAEDDGPLTVGRSPLTNLSLSWDPEVSSVHAEFQCVAGRWLVADDGLSSNGTFVNGRRITGRERLEHLDSIRFGRTTAVFRLPPSERPGPTAASSETISVEKVSATQRRVLVALCRPFQNGSEFTTPATNEEIAVEVYLGKEAVKAHLRTMFHRFELTGLPPNQKRTRLAELALQWGLVTPRDY